MWKTPRLDLVPATPELLRAALAGREALGEALAVEVPDSWPPDHFDRGAIRYALSMLVSPRQRGWWTWYFVERSARRLVGAGGYKGAPTDGAVEIGYAIVSEHQRRGIATEAAAGLVERAFADPRVERVLAETLAGHRTSQAVLRRCGFVPVGGSSAPGVDRFEKRRHGPGRAMVAHMSKRPETTPLLEAAEAVEQELRIFERLASEALDISLDSQKRLGKAGRTLTELCEVEEQLQAKVAHLVGVIGTARDKQQRLAGQIQEWALQLQARAATFQALRMRLAGLAEQVAPISEAASADEVDLEAIGAQIEAAAAQAEALEADANAQDFADVAREGKARKEQLLAALAKLQRVSNATLPEA